MWLAVVSACASRDPGDVPSVVDTGPTEAPWSRELPPSSEIPVDRGFSVARAITHLHSPWSHDACDGNPLPDGAPNAECLADLRDGLCATRVDAAFVSDHPDFGALQAYDDLFMAQPGDTPWPTDGAQRANQIHCADGHVVTWFPGNEDETMPLALDRQPLDDPEANNALLNGYDAATVQAERDAGAVVFVAHTESRADADLAMLQDAGIAGVELFNLHAMFDPDTREEWLGLEPYAWIADIAPFTESTDIAEPDLLVLAVLQEQGISVAHWDALLARGPAVGIAGTDAHQNVLPTVLRDGERGDSYRRMLRWFANFVLVQSSDPGEVETALAAGRSYAAFEVFGTPSGFSFHYDLDGSTTEMGGSAAPGGELVLDCPTLLPGSPRGPDLPEITATIFRDGQPWQTGCGSFPVTEAGDYRVRVDVVPLHLRPFLGYTPDPWLHAYPWVYGNAVRIR